MTHPALRWQAFPWEGLLLDAALVVLWRWALPPAMALCLAWPHLSVWVIALLQSLTVGRMVSLYLSSGREPALLGRLQPLVGLAAVLSVGGFLWVMGAMAASPVSWGAVTQRLPLILVFTTLGALGLQMDRTNPRRSLPTRAGDTALVVLYLFAAEAFLFAMSEGADPTHRRGLLLGLVLSHLPMRLLFASVPPTSRYELVSAAVAFGALLQAVWRG